MHGFRSTWRIKRKRKIKSRRRPSNKSWISWMVRIWTARKMTNLSRNSNIKKEKFKMQLMACCSTRTAMLCMRPNWMNYSNSCEIQRVLSLKKFTGNWESSSTTYKLGNLIQVQSSVLKNSWNRSTSKIRMKKFRIWSTGQSWLSLASTPASKVLTRPSIVKPSI